MISQLVAALRNLHLEPTDEEVADILWLALHLGPTPSVSTEPEPSVEPTPPSDGVDSPPGGEAVVPPVQPPAAPERKARLYPGAHTRDGEEEMAGMLPFRAPGEPALGRTLELGRALRPLMRKVASHTRFELDEARTSQRIAEEGIWLPVMNPAQERWLEVALVVDESRSMTIWWHTIGEFQLLLERHGAFRDVRIWGLGTDEKGKNPRLRMGIGRTAQGQPTRPLSELLDPSGRRLILVISDCVKQAWYNGVMVKEMREWGRQNPLALLQVLPRSMWRMSALGDADAARLRASVPGQPNMQLAYRLVTDWAEGEDVRSWLRLPTVTLDPVPLKDWALALTSTENVWARGYLLEPEASWMERLAEEEEEEDVSTEERLKRFRATASPTARKLAGLLSATPITLPIVRLIQRTMLAKAELSHVAEVFLGGILEQLPGQDGGDADDIRYDFREGIRDLLLDGQPINESVQVLRNISAFIEDHFGQFLDFRALLADPESALDAGPTAAELGSAPPMQEITDETIRQIQPFALIGAKVLRRLGGRYAHVAERLEREVGGAIPPLPETEKAGGTAPVEEEQAGGDLAERIRSLNNTGDTYLSQGKYEDALSIYESARVLAEQTGDPSAIAAALTNIGQVYKLQGKLEEALEYFQQAVPLFFEQIGGRAALADLFAHIGEIYRNLGRLEEALDYFQRALALWEQVGNPADIATSLNNIGAIYDSQGQLEEALDYFQRALALFEQVGNPADIAASLKIIGLIYSSQGQLEEALDYFQRALALWEQVGNPADIAAAEIREVIDTIAKKAVLILGRFTPDRKAVLDALREALRTQGYLPILFDFDKPSSRDMTETVSTLAHLARFIVADLTEPSSLPKELEAVVPTLAVPVQPILEGSTRPYAMFKDYWKYQWVLEVYRYNGLEELLASLKEHVIEPAEQKARELAKLRAQEIEDRSYTSRKRGTTEPAQDTAFRLNDSQIKRLVDAWLQQSILYVEQAAQVLNIRLETISPSGGRGNLSARATDLVDYVNRQGQIKTLLEYLRAMYPPDSPISEICRELLGEPVAGGRQVAVPTKEAGRPAPRMRSKVFISYSQKDKRWLDRLRLHLSLFERAGEIEVWDDTKIAVGASWKEEIKEALEMSRVAVLLVSPDFLASDFISNQELPALIKAAEEREIRLLPILVRPCAIEETELYQFQFLNDPRKPLSGMRRAQQEEAFMRAAETISRLVREAEQPRPPMVETEQWIRPGQGKVIALVHGIGARSALDYWHTFLQVLQIDEKLRDFGLFVWKYPTHLEPGLWRNLLGSVKGATLHESSPRIKVLGGVWNTTYQAQFADYRDVILICHSMGGLVVKSWIVDTLQKGQSQQLDTVRHITFYATPHEGAPVTTLASWNKQLKDMQLDSPFIEEVGQRWYEHVVAWKEKPLEASERLYNRYIPHLVVAGANDNVVPIRSASIRGMNTTLVVGNHSQVIQPQDASDTRYKTWREDMQKVLQMGQPSAPSLGLTQQSTKNVPQLMPSAGPDAQKALSVFFSYAPEDEALVKELEKQLALLSRQGRIAGWFSRNMGAGEETEKEIVAHLNQARVILLLISPDFLAFEQYWNTEVLLAMQKHEAKETCVIPVLLRPTDNWKSAPFGKLQALPKNEKPVISWSIRDEAFAEVARGIREAVEKLTSSNP